MERTRVIPAVATNAMITSRHQKWKQEKETHPKACNIWVCLKQVARPMLIVNVAAKGGALGTLRGAIPTHLLSQGDGFQGVKDVKRNRRKVSGQSAPDGRIDWLHPTTANLTSSDQSSIRSCFAPGPSLNIARYRRPRCTKHVDSDNASIFIPHSFNVGYSLRSFDPRYPPGYEAELATNPPIGKGIIIPYHED